MPEYDSREISSFLRGLRQRRRFTDEIIPYEVIDDILEVARWTGSAKNNQPWDLVVVRDRDTLAQLAESGTFAGFLRGVDVAIVIALNAGGVGQLYDEGRLSERIMLIAEAYGLGSGTGWFSEEPGQTRVKELLGIPQDRFVHSAVGLGYIDTSVDDRPNVTLGRRPLSDVVSYGRFGQHEA
ncbi:MAG TPA: nitroreductase family protein [Thermomicrobiales bacterium]|nr:nitroreductase family protein [Thermomicrobiales bacterium]